MRPSRCSTATSGRRCCPCPSEAWRSSAPSCPLPARWSGWSGGQAPRHAPLKWGGQGPEQGQEKMMGQRQEYVWDQDQEQDFNQERDKKVGQDQDQDKLYALYSFILFKDEQRRDLMTVGEACAHPCPCRRHCSPRRRCYSPPQSHRSTPPP